MKELTGYINIRSESSVSKHTSISLGVFQMSLLYANVPKSQISSTPFADSISFATHNITTTYVNILQLASNRTASKISKPAFAFTVPASAIIINALDGSLPASTIIINTQDGSPLASAIVINAHDGGPNASAGIINASAGVIPVCAGIIPANEGGANANAGNENSFKIAL